MLHPSRRIKRNLCDTLSNALLWSIFSSAVLALVADAFSHNISIWNGFAVMRHFVIPYV